MREVAVIGDPSRLAELAGEWDALLARSASDTVFLTWDWLWSWWEVYGASVEPCVATVREDGRLVAAAPCKVEERRRYGMTYRQLDFLGAGRAVWPDFLDVVVEAGREPELVPVLVGALVAERRWDKLSLTDLSAASPTRAPLAAALAAGGVRTRIEAGRPCPYVPLPATWSELEARLTHNFRRNHRKKRRRARAGLATWQTGDDLDPALATLAVLHQQRMEAAGREGNFRKPDYRAFHERFAARAARRGWLYLAFLERDGRPIAARYGFLYRDVYYAYQSGFASDAADDSPGEVLLGLVIEDLIARGARELNFLRGVEPHKLHWTDRARQTVRFEAWPRTARAQAVALLDRMAAQRKRLHRRFPGLFGPLPVDVLERRVAG